MTPPPTESEDLPLAELRRLV
ncbi:MAG: hypothetical protein JWO83_3509, partial [Caulobacteraceae bacterium]|nr:hypothetical protein [Caulobacteraceae bacterium]